MDVSNVVDYTEVESLRCLANNSVSPTGNNATVQRDICFTREFDILLTATQWRCLNFPRRPLRQ